MRVVPFLFVAAAAPVSPAYDEPASRRRWERSLPTCRPSKPGSSCFSRDTINDERRVGSGNVLSTGQQEYVNLLLTCLV
jgi:hypothetical protein